MTGIHGEWGEQRFDDGKSREFQPDSTDPRMVLAMRLAKSGGWAEIRPGHWGEAGRLVKELKGAGLLATKREIAARECGREGK